MSDKQRKICFVGLYNEKNLGDPIIFDCTEWLYGKCVESGDFVSQRLYLDYVQKTYRPSIMWKVRNRVARIFSPGRLYSLSFEKMIFKKTREYFETYIKDFDLVVVVGGGIVKWTYQFFYAELTALLNAAESLNVPVVFNAVGVEGYSDSDFKCRMLKQAMQLPALIHVSTRDDLETLAGKYYDGNPRRPLLRVSDPAVWVSEAYGIKKKESRKIGVGVVRGGIFNDNAIDFGPVELLTLYKDVIRTLAADGCDVEVFTNGLPADNDFAEQVCASLVEDGVSVCRRYPENTHELVDIISGYMAIVAARLHACIIAYSLDVPAVGLVWNDKLPLFGRNILAEDNFIKHDDFSAAKIVGQLYKAAAAGYDQAVKSEFRQTIIEDIMEIDRKTISMEMKEHILIGGGKIRPIHRLNNRHELRFCA
ncbi:polysaccharide pyruvyl transferase family protein [Bacteroides acidifaciens]|uniref:polysaccharide pyruvyl transferase family protein n=1 Tax=Bacteroides acidifaciens TaxID=85831 RepID=UPI00259B6037|nr:polysaccharide pyruvyl transferase family protein [Bacteroides acidifaciens]